MPQIILVGGPCHLDIINLDALPDSLVLTDPKDCEVIPNDLSEGLITPTVSDFMRVHTYYPCEGENIEIENCHLYLYEDCSPDSVDMEEVQNEYHREITGEVD